MIVANKTDQDPGLREVTREEGHVFAIENGSRYYETSAKDPERAEDVGEVFQVRENMSIYQVELRKCS